MGCGFSDALGGRGSSSRIWVSGDGENAFTVYPNDPRWTTLSNNNDTSWIVWNDLDFDTKSIDVNELWKEWEKERLTKGCCCGAKATKDWNCHAHWCPAHRPYK